VFKKLALIGCGLMGGSFALAARQAKWVGSVCGYSRSPASAQKALELGIVDAVAASAADCVRSADLVLLAVPVASTQATLSSLLPQLDPQALVMDVGSTKADVVRAAEQALGERIAQFMPAHPICGKEVAGIEHADAKLYAGQQVILTPLPVHSAAQIERARALWAALGCQVKTLEPQLHDEALAAVSHFPHLLAFAFMDSLMQQADGERYLALAGPGFRDSTRIAAGDPDLWADALLANATQVVAQSQRLQQSLHALEELLHRGDRAALRQAIEQVSQRRSAWRMGQG
jgi:prephenate dehydrogenase